MKKGIHPNWNTEAKVIFNGKEVMTVGSTEAELHVEIWSGNHPFYTGKEMLVDTDNLVERFNKKREQAQGSAVNTKARKNARRKVQKTSTFATKQVTLKDMLKDFN